jgi:hypothetical protein
LSPITITAQVDDGPAHVSAGDSRPDPTRVECIKRGSKRYQPHGAPDRIRYEGVDGEKRGRGKGRGRRTEETKRKYVES